MGRRTEWTLSKEELQMANRLMIRYTALLTIREMQVKIIIRYGLTPVRMAIIKKSTNNKLLEENIGRPLSDTYHSIIFLYLSPRIMEIKAKINKWNPLKLKSFCVSKETINKMKRKLTDWEKIFANDVTDKRLVSKIYKQAIQLNGKKKKNSI